MSDASEEAMRNASPKGRLLDLLRTRSYEKKRVRLASGRESDFFIDCKNTVLTAEGHALSGEVLYETVRGFSAQAVAGVELGGCPLASAVSLTSYQRGAGLDAIYVRKDAKDHGSARLLEGAAHLAEATTVVLLEDVLTTGGSSLRAIEKLRAHGFSVAGCVVLVDRDEGGSETLRRVGIEVSRIFSRHDFEA